MDPKNKAKEESIKIYLFILLIILLITQLFINYLPLFAQSDKMLWHPRNKLSLIEFFQYSNLWISLLFGLLSTLLLLFIKIKTWIRIFILFLIIIFFAVLPAYSNLSCTLRTPSPLCSLIRPLIFIKSGNLNFPIKFIAALLTISILSLIGNKIFCGWVCPVGAFQEIINLSPFFSKRKIKIAFWKSNLVRLILFAAFIPILLLMGRIIYFNPFAPVRWGISGNNWEFYSWFLLSAMLVASFFIYRPYCYFICPIGLITWLLEQISPNKIIYFREKCSNCKTCIKDSSCPTVESILQEKHILPDCHSCGKCVEVCPNDALKFGFKLPFIRKKRKKIE